LDHSLLTEARIASNETRRVCFGLEENASPVDELELPSYNNHILDRVANSFFPADALRVPNPWVMRGIEGALPSEVGTSPLDFANSELMVSLGQLWRDEHRSTHLPNSLPTSEPSSRRNSRQQSRASSPERSNTIPIPRLEQTSATSSTSSSPRHTNRFLKPFTSLSSSRRSAPSLTSLVPTDAGTSSSGPYANISSSSSTFTAQPQSQTSQTPCQLRNSTSEYVQPVPLSAAPSTSEASSLLISAFRDVPGYDVASRGFLGGGIPPLELLRDLPSYEETERRSASAPLIGLTSQEAAAAVAADTFSAFQAPSQSPENLSAPASGSGSSSASPTAPVHSPLGSSD